MTESLNDLFWPVKTLEYPNGSVITYTEVEGRNPFMGQWVPEGVLLDDEEIDNEDWDELEHVKEQYEIKCDELRIAHNNILRLSKILIEHGLDDTLIIEDEDDKEDDESEA